VDPNTTGYRATAGKYSSEPHGHIRVRAGMDKPKAAKAAPKAANPWSGIPSSFRSEVLDLGISPKVPPDAAQAFVQEWTQKGAFRRSNLNGKLVEGFDPRAKDAMRKAREALNSKYRADRGVAKTGVSTVDALFGD
jgi:hypothetical protein